MMFAIEVFRTKVRGVVPASVFLPIGTLKPVVFSMSRQRSPSLPKRPESRLGWRGLHRYQEAGESQFGNHAFAYLETLLVFDL
jgi:hypothetical protein